MNLKLIGLDLINFDNVLHVSFAPVPEVGDAKGLRVKFRFVDGLERELGHREAVITLKWIEHYTDSEVDDMGRTGDLASLVRALDVEQGPRP